MKFVRSSTLCFISLVLLCNSAKTALQVNPAIKASQDIAVVVNARNVYDDLSLDDMRRILMGERRFWKGNIQVSLVLRQDGARERDHVISLVLKMTNAEFERHWQAKVFRGEASALPLSVPSNGMASEYVADTPGGISFVIGTNLRPDLKVLKINGKLPGEPGYPLK